MPHCPISGDANVYVQDIASDIVVVFRDTVYSVVSPITKCLTGRNSAALAHSAHEGRAAGLYA